MYLAPGIGPATLHDRLTAKLLLEYLHLEVVVISGEERHGVGGRQCPAHWAEPSLYRQQALV